LPQNAYLRSGVKTVEIAYIAVYLIVYLIKAMQASF